MLTIGHRGLGSEYPENTLPAIQDAANYVDIVEVDVRRCASGELVVVHDENLQRLTGRNASVSETDIATLRELTVGESSEPIPTFAEVLRAWPEGTGINVDVKGSTPVEAAVRQLAESAIDGPRVVSVHRQGLASFDPKTVDVPVGLSVDQNPDESVKVAADRGCRYVHVHYPLCLETDVVDRAHAVGLAVDAWTVSDAATTRRLKAKGVDAVTVDTREALE